MSGTTIDNWGSFDKSMLTGLRGSGKVDHEGVLASKVTEVKDGNLPTSTVKKVLLGIVTFGIYNIIDTVVHSVNGKNQQATIAALKQGVDDVHAALSYVSIESRKNLQAYKEQCARDGRTVDGHEAPPFQLNVSDAKKFFEDHNKGQNISVMQEGNDPVFGNTPFLRLSFGGVLVDICPNGLEGATIRLNGVESNKPITIHDPEGGIQDYTIVDMPDLEESLYRLEKDIVRTTDVFGGDLVESMLTRYDSRLDIEKTLHKEKGSAETQMLGGAAELTAVEKRTEIKDRQLELCRDILTMRCGMSQERIDYLDRDLAKQLAIQAVRDNITSGPALDAHYDKIVSQRHLVGEDMLALYKKLDAPGNFADKVHLPAAAAQAAPVAGRPTAQQQGVHDFAADLLLSDDISDYDKDVGTSGNLDGLRLRNVFGKHRDTIAALMDARAADKSRPPADLASLEPVMQDAIVKLLDKLEEMKAEADENAQKEHRFGFGADPNKPPQPLTSGAFVDKLCSDFDRGVKDARAHRKNDMPVPSRVALGHLVEVDDLSSEVQAHEVGVSDSKDDDYRRRGMANFFAQMELELNKRVEATMRDVVQASVKTMIANVFPKESAAALDSHSPLSTIVADRASDPQMKLLKQTLDVYFERMGDVDKRNMMARLVRNIVAGAPDGMRLGEMLKGAGPVLQKMLQGLDPDAFTDPDFKAAISDMRSKLAPIPEKAVKAQFADLIARSGGAIESINVTRALGAASVGQTFLCTIKMKGEDEPRECVIKMLRPDAHLRALREAEVFRDVAKGIEGMSLTFEGKLAGIMQELDLTVEAANVRTGLDVYDAGTHKVNKTFANVASMRLSDIPGTDPTRGLMVLERAPGVSMDKFLEDANKSITSDKATAVAGITGRGGDSAIISMLDGAESLTGTYEDALGKHDALANLTTIWIREGLFTKTGFYHGDLHAGNIMVPTAQDIAQGIPNGVTMIDFGNARKLSSDEQKNVIRIIAGAAGNDPTLFLNGLNELLSADGKSKLAGHRQEVEGIVRDIFSQGTGNDAGLRMTAVFKLLQAKFSIEVPAAISGFQSSQERLTVAMESMLRTMTSAEMARLDVILAAAKEEGVDVPDFGAPSAQSFAAKKNAALAYLNSKLGGELTQDVRDRLSALKKKLEEADVHRPMSMMQCMVAVIKQNIVTSLKTLGTDSAKTVTAQLKKDGLIGGAATADPTASEKERRFVEIRP